MINQYNNIMRNKIRELQKQLEIIEEMQDKLFSLESDMMIHRKPKEPGLFSKFFKTKKYKTYLKLLEEHEQVKEKYESKKEEVDKLQSTEELSKEINELQAEWDRTYGDIKYIVEYFKENNIPLVMTKSDFEITIRKMKNAKESGNNRKMEKLEDVMLVHKTNYSPKDNTIGTRTSSNVVDSIDVTIGGKVYFINVKPRRDTVHFAVNHEVTANSGGSWNDCKYIIIVPLLSIPKEQFGSNRCADTFTNGKVILDSNCYILCLKEEMERVQKDNPNVTVVGCEDTEVMNYGNAFLWGLGYSVEDGNDWGYNDVSRQNDYHDLLSTNGYTKFASHSNTEDKAREEKLFNINFMAGALELIKNNSELWNIDDEVISNGTYFNSCITEISDEGMNKIFKTYLNELGFDVEAYTKFLNEKHPYEAIVKYLIEEAKELGKTNNFTK